MICAPLRACSALGYSTLEGWQELVNVGQATRLLTGWDRRDRGVGVIIGGSLARSGVYGSARQTGPASVLGAVLDFGRGFCLALFYGGLERGVVAFVLVGVGFGKVGDRLVALGGAAEVGGEGDAVTGTGVRPARVYPHRRA